MNHLFRGAGRLTLVVTESASGTVLNTACGRELLDFTSGMGVTNTGHCHPKVVEAAKRQCDALIHGQVNLGYHKPMMDLTTELMKPGVMPHSKLDKIFYSTTGSEAVENAIKLAKQKTGRPNVISFRGYSHGKTNMNMVLTTSAMIYRQRISTTNNILMAPFPHELHGQQYTTESCLKELEMMLEMQTLPEEVAAIIVEPVNRESGYVPASREFMKGLRKICNKHGIVFIVDEVNTGFGRTGELFASNYHHEGSPPDILVLSKGFASGFPLSAIVTSEAISRHFQDADTLAGGMYSGSAVSYAAALATQQVIQEENLVENAKIQGERLWNGLMEIQKKHPSIIRDVRGPGCMIGVELQPKAVPGTNKVLCFQSYEKGLLILPASSAFPTVKFIPPLSVKEKEIDKALDIFERTLTEFE